MRRPVARGRYPEPRAFRWPLLDDISKYCGTADLFEWIDDQADQLSALGSVGGDFVEFTDALREARAVAEIRPVAPSEMRSPGRLSHGSPGYRIDVHWNLPATFKRYVIAHEIGHTLWIRPGTTTPISGCQSPGADADIEYLCDWFASALLMPRRLVLPAIAHLETPIDLLNNISTLARRFMVPERVAVSRVFGLRINRRWATVRFRHRRPDPQPSLFSAPDDQSCWYLSWLINSAEVRTTESRRFVPHTAVHDQRQLRGSVPLIQDGQVLELSDNREWSAFLSSIPELWATFHAENKSPGEVFCIRAQDSVYCFSAA